MSQIPIFENGIADWGRVYRKFIERSKSLGRWPFATEDERKTEWETYKELSVYRIGE